MKRFLKAIIKIIFSRTLIIALMILIQAAVFPLALTYLRNYFPAVVEAMSLMGGIMIIIIINNDEPAEFKLTWAIFVCLFPVLGTLIYVFVKSNWGMAGLRRKVRASRQKTEGLTYTSKGTHSALERESASFRRFAYYMEKTCGYPVYHNTVTTYYPTGEETIEALKEDLKKAKKFIFMEFFIIDDGIVWDSILKILKEKVKEGVEVYVMYDGLCSIMLLPYYYPKKLASYGIHSKMFAPLVPFLSTTQNNRDHRKIVVIDGEVAFTGGVNLADEYANIKERFGYWKDAGIRLEGRAAMSFSLMFMQNWNIYGKKEIDYEKYLKEDENRQRHEHDGFVIPYGDTPTLLKEVAKTVYEDIFAHAVDYIHIMTPYFIVDREFLSVMRYAALRGVDVKMILPHIPDKRYAFFIARTFYRTLCEAGIKVYEYKPGFVHAKIMVSDDRMATCGSVNLDYRSFYHHFENGVCLYENSSVKKIEEDFENTLKDCIEVNEEYYKNIPVYQRILGRILRLVAPMM